MSKKKMSVKPLKDLLERVYLNGLIKECLLEMEDNKGSIVAIDVSNSVLISVNAEVPGLDNGKYGITNLDTLVKFLKHCGEEELTYSVSEDGKWLALRRRGHGKFSSMLAEPDLIATVMTEKPDIHSYTETYAAKLPIKARFVEDAIYYMSLVSNQGVEFVVDKNSNVKLQSTNATMQHFEVQAGKDENGSSNVSCKLYSNQLQAVLSALPLEEGANLYLTNEYPAIITKDSENAWALTQIVT